MIRSGEITQTVERHRGKSPNLGDLEDWVRDHHQAVSRNEAMARLEEARREAYIAEQREKGTLSLAGLERYLTRGPCPSQPRRLLNIQGFYFGREKPCSVNR